MWFYALFWLACAHKSETPWLAAARIYGEPEELPPLHGDRGHFFHPFELEHNAKSVLTHPRPEWWDWLPVFKAFSDRPLLNESTVQADAQKLEAWFHDHGWFDAKITWTTKVHKRSGGTIINYYATYGSRVQIQKVEVIDWPEGSQPPINKLEDQYWNTTLVQKHRTDLLQQLHELGYAAAEVTISHQQEKNNIFLQYQVEAHQPSFFGSIQVLNLTPRSSARLEYIAAQYLSSGSEFDKSKVDRLRHRLESTPAYGSVQLNTNIDSTEYSVDITLEPTEADKWDLKPFALVASEATAYEVGGGFQWKRTHLGQRNASVSGRHLLGYRAFPFFKWPPSVELSNHGLVSDQKGELWFSLFPMRGLSLAVRAHNQLGAEIGYQQFSNTVQSGLRWSPRSSFVFFGGAGYGQDLFFAYASQQNTYEEWFGSRGLASQTERIFGVFSFDADWVDDKDTPLNGFQWRLQAQPYGSIQGLPYTRIHNDMRVLVGAGPWSFTQRVAAGQVWWHKTPLNSLSLRFFLGGGQSVRAWGRRRLEAPGYNGNVMDPRLGGDVMLHSSSELRYTLFPNWSILTFLDAGRVWHTPEDIALNQLLPSVGGGLRAPTPIGVATATIGYQLIEKNELVHPPFRINGHFVLSESF